MEALRAGLSIGEFWALTPRETLVAMEAAVWRAEQAAAGQISLAWHIAALSRSKKLPGLKKLLAPVKQSKAKQQPIEERRREFDELTARMAKAKVRPHGR